MTTSVETYRNRFALVKGPIIAYVGLALLYIIVLPKKYVWFSWHPFATVIAFIGLASNATIIKKIGGLENTRLHGYLMSAATALALFGGYVIYTNKEMMKRPHLYSLHGKTGALILVSYLGLGLFGGIFLHPDFGLLKKNQLLRKVHKYAGLAVTALSWLCCVSGFATLHQSVMERALFAVPLVALAYFVLL